jgi:hypothetical protein
MSKVLKPGLLWLSGTSVSPTVTYYPDPFGIDTTPPAGTHGLSDSSIRGVFNVAGRDGILHGVSMNKVSTGTILNIIIKGTSTVVASFKGSLTQQQYFHFGPEGLRIPGGFEIESTGVGGSNFTVHYEVV